MGQGHKITEGTV